MVCSRTAVIGTLVVALAACGGCDQEILLPRVINNVLSVFSAGLASISCYRIPSIVQTDKGTLIAFAEARHGSCSDSNVHEIATRRSTDGGKTWSDVAFAAGNSSYFVGNPTAVFTNSGRVMLIFCQAHKVMRGWLRRRQRVCDER